MKRFFQGIRKSLVKTLIFSNGFVILLVFVVAFALTGAFNAQLSLRREQSMMHSYLVNTLQSVDNQLRDMSRVSMVAYADETAQDIMKNSRRYTFQQKLDSDAYLKRLFSNLITIRNDVRGILIFDQQTLLFKQDNRAVSLKSQFRMEEYPEFFQIGEDSHLASGCNVTVGPLPEFLHGNQYADPFERNYLIVVREVKSFKPHEKIGYIMLLSPVSVLNQTLESSVDPQSRYMLLDANRRIICEPGGGRISRPLSQLEAGLDRRIAAGEPNGFTYPMDGQRYIVSYETSAYSGFTLVVAKPTAQVYRDAVRIMWIVVAVSLAAIFTAVLLTAHFTRKTIRPITNLSRAMATVTKGNTRISEPIISQDETSRLTSAFNDMMDTINDLIFSEYENTIRLQEAQLAQKETQLLYLRSQINPHFLYNTLDTIRIKAALNGDGAVAEMIMQLVSFFRFSMGTNQLIVTIEHEIQLIRVYLRLMKYRYPALEDDYQIDPALLEKHIPNFILQPLVENSLLHGLRSVNYRGRVTLYVGWDEERPGDILIRVTDNGGGIPPETMEKLDRMLRTGEGFTDETPRRDHLGVRNVQERLRLFYPEGYGVHYEPGPGGGVSAVLRLKEAPSAGAGPAQGTGPAQGAGPNRAGR